ncbi:MAG: hypothetical protein OXF85_00115 [Candidatus Saccharibacteria bacterium]|nr:hypothetical protein [Candidatus Saccharibacteria bacterium]
MKNKQLDGNRKKKIILLVVPLIILLLGIILTVVNNSDDATDTVDSSDSNNEQTADNESASVSEDNNDQTPVDDTANASNENTEVSTSASFKQQSAPSTNNEPSQNSNNQQPVSNDPSNENTEVSTSTSSTNNNNEPSQNSNNQQPTTNTNTSHNSDTRDEDPPDYSSNNDKPNPDPPTTNISVRINQVKQNLNLVITAVGQVNGSNDSSQFTWRRTVIDSNTSCDIQAFSDTTKVSNGRTKIITQAQKDDYVNKKICFHAVLTSNSNLQAYAGANIIPLPEPVVDDSPDQEEPTTPEPIILQHFNQRQTLFQQHLLIRVNKSNLRDKRTLTYSYVVQPRADLCESTSFNGSKPIQSGQQAIFKKRSLRNTKPNSQGNTVEIIEHYKTEYGNNNKEVCFRATDGITTGYIAVNINTDLFKPRLEIFTKFNGEQQTMTIRARHFNLDNYQASFKYANINTGEKIKDSFGNPTFYDHAFTEVHERGTYTETLTNCPSNNLDTTTNNGIVIFKIADLKNHLNCSVQFTLTGVVGLQNLPTFNISKIPANLRPVTKTISGLCTANYCKTNIVAR